MPLVPLLLLAATAPAAPARAQFPDAAEIVAAAHAFNLARGNGDRATLEAMLAPDYLFVRGSGGVGDRRDFIAGVTAAGQKLEPFRVVDPLFVRVDADVAIVGGEARVAGFDRGRPFAGHFRYADTFARRGGRWLVVYTQMTPLP